MRNTNGKPGLNQRPIIRYTRVEDGGSAEVRTGGDGVDPADIT